VNLLIAGPRTMTVSLEEIDDAFGAPILRSDVDRVVCGMAEGMDLCGLRWAQASGIEVIKLPVTNEDYERHGRYKAPKVRNWRMAKVAEVGLIWWDGYSGGTAHMIAAMRALDKFVRICKPRGA
jgi:hypothetical protein